MARIGFVGLGHMGLPMAINLINAGHQVTGFDLQVDPLKTLTDAGGIAAQQLIDTACNQDVVITMLQNGQQVQQVALGDAGLLASMLKGSLYIDCSTIDVTTARLLHQAAHACELLSLDSPVSGGVAGATAGTLTFMVGGSENSLRAAHPILSTMGKKIIHAGPEGSGQAAKICNNMILGVSMIAVSEAFVLAEQLGLTPQKLHEVVSNASGQCWVMNSYVPVPDVLDNVPANREYQPGFSVAMMLKDLCLGQQVARESDTHMPMAECATTLYQQFCDTDHANLDFSAIIQSLR